MNIMAGSMGGVMPPVPCMRLAIVSVVLNNICNLHCRHCYLAPDMATPALSPSEWTSFFDSVFRELRPSVVTFAGKEIFADIRSAGVMFRAIEQRNQLQATQPDKTRIGVITNGTLLRAYRQSLLAVTPDWIDVSIDGLPAAHDAVRGAGAFRRLEPNLRWLVEELFERLWVTFTLMAHNADQLGEAVEFFNAEFGIRRFSIGVYKPLSYTDHLFALREDKREERIMRSLNRLVDVRLRGPVTVQVECDYDDELQAVLATNGMSLKGWPLAQRSERYENGLTLMIRGMRVPVGLWRAVRVTADGYWLAAEDLVDAKRYAENAVGSVRNYNFDSVRLYCDGLGHSRFGQLTGMTAEAFLEHVRRAS